MNTVTALATTVIATVAIIVLILNQLDSNFDRLHTRLSALETRIESTNVLLSGNLVTLNRDIGILAGAAHVHGGVDSPFPKSH